MNRWRILVAMALALALGTPTFAQRPRWRKGGDPAGRGQAAPPRAGDDDRRWRTQTDHDKDEHPVRPHAGPHAGQALRNILNLPEGQRSQALENDPQFKTLAPEEQQRLRDRLQHFNSLPPQRQQQILDRMDRFGHLSPEQQQRARSLYQRFRELPEERKAQVARAFHFLRRMAPEDRDKFYDSARFRTDFSDEEREMLRGFADLDIGPSLRDGTEDKAPPPRPK